MPVSPYITLPLDQYPHPGAPAEWWWHVGTLSAGSRTFGFEISAGGFLTSATVPAFLMANIMLTDVETGTHFQQLSAYPWDATWAEGCPGQQLSVNVGQLDAPGSIAFAGEPTPTFLLKPTAQSEPGMGVASYCNGRGCAHRAGEQQFCVPQAQSDPV